jgi:hypothetical protein
VITAELPAHDATEAVLIRAAHGLATGGGEVEAAS